MQKIIRTLPFAYLIFKFYFAFFNTTVQKLLVIFLVSIYIITNFNKCFDYEDKGRFNSNLIGFGLIFLISLVVPIIHGTGDYSYARKLITNINDLLCWVAFAIHVKKESSDDNVLIVLTEKICFITSLYVAFTAMCMIFSPLRQLWQSVVYFSEKELFELQYAKYIGRIGWDGFAGFNATFMCTFGIMLCLICLMNINTFQRKGEILNVKSMVKYIVILLFGNVIYGRTGLLASLVMIALFLIISSFVQGKGKYLFGSVGVIILVVAAVLVLKNYITALNSLYEWAFEPLINYINGNGFSATSLDKLKVMYVKPTGNTLMFGDGYYTDISNNTYYKNIDVGVLRLVFLWGVVPTVIAYWITFKTFSKTILNNKYIWLFIVLLLFLFEIKGEAYRMMLYIFCAISLLGIGANTRRYTKVVFRRKN